VMRLRRNGIVVLVPRFGIEGNIFLIDNDARKAGACGHTPVLAPCMAVTGCVFDFDRLQVRGCIHLRCGRTDHYPQSQHLSSPQGV